MSTYAVIKSGGKQYKVSEGERIWVDRLTGEAGDKIQFTPLLVVADQKVFLGKPQVENGIVEALVINHIKGEKIYVAKYKAKVRYRKRIGFRAKQTELQIEKIGWKSEELVI